MRVDVGYCGMYLDCSVRGCKSELVDWIGLSGGGGGGESR